VSDTEIFGLPEAGNLDKFGPTRGGLPQAPERIVESLSKGGWPKPFDIDG